MFEELDSESFDEFVSEGLVVVDFWAPWCGPCKVLEKTLESVAEKREGLIEIGKVNTDSNMDLAQRFGVRSIPTIMIYKDGEKVRELIGSQSEGDFLAELDQITD